MVINTSCHCTQQCTLDWTLSCFMTLHSTIFVMVVRTVAFAIFFLVFGPPHALCHSNCFLYFRQNCSFRRFRHFGWGLWTLSCLMPFHSAIFFVIFVKIVVSIIFLGAFGHFHASRNHSAIFMLCLSVSLTTSDYL